MYGKLQVEGPVETPGASLPAQVLVVGHRGTRFAPALQREQIVLYLHTHILLADTRQVRSDDEAFFGFVNVHRR